MIRVGVTGASGYLGGRLIEQLAGVYDVRPLTRREFELGEPPSTKALEGLNLLIHCAWDLKEKSSHVRARRNIEGTRALLRCATELGIGPFIFISSLAAFPGCETENGQAKLQIEEEVLAAGGIVLRPGMILSRNPGGVFGEMSRLSSRFGVSFRPIPDPQIWVVSEGELLQRCADIIASADAHRGRTFEVAYRSPVPLSQIFALAARFSGRWCLPLPLPLRSILSVMELLEWFSLPNRAESFRSLLAQRSTPLMNNVCEYSDPRPELLEALRIRRAHSEVENTSAIYERKPSTWFWASPAAQKRAHRRAQLLFQRFHGGAALELGPGSGVFSELFAERFHEHLVTVDLSHEEVSQAPHSKRVCGDIVKLPFRSASFDFIFGSSILHHVTLEELLPELKRVLRPGGVIAFAEPNLLNPQIFLQKFFPALKEAAADVAHEGAFSRWALRRALEAEGFSEAQVIPFDFLHPSLPSSLITAFESIGGICERLPLLREIAGSLLISATLPANALGEQLCSERSLPQELSQRDF